jgi:iron complex outermembrane receptor protein
MNSQRTNNIPAQSKFSLLKKASLFATAGASALLVASSAYAQDSGVESVTVSSSRIMNSGMNAPTPTTVLSTNFIEQQAKDNIFNAVTQLPSMMGSTGVQSGVNGTSGGTNGLASFNMFGLGTIRTLTLLDGQRFIPANVTGVNDINQFPQLLIQRVDVVTGGASASWGSDAVSGVVNFITDKKYIGFKTNISTGISDYNDNATLTIQAAAGTSFAGGRGHFSVSVDYSHSDGVEGNYQKLTCCGGNSLKDALGHGRTWYTSPTTLRYASPAATPAGQPQFFNTYNGTPNTIARTGIINSGPLMGIIFNPDGSTARRDYGVGPNGLQGVAAGGGSATTTGNVTNCIVEFCIGGDLSAQHGSGGTMSTPITRGNIYARLSYDLTPDWNLWTTVSLAEVQTSNNPNSNAWRSSLPGIAGAGGANVPNLATTIVSTAPFNLGQNLIAGGIQCGNAVGGANAFLPASINAACVTAGITSFGFGSQFEGLGPQKVHTLRDNRRYAMGLDGTFNLFNTEWSAAVYAEHGENNTRIDVRGITLLPYLYSAIDSVRDSSGVAVCRNTVARAMGCVPINPFSNEYTQGQKNWVYGGTKWGPGPIQLSKQFQNAAEFVVSGSPISNWAGDVSVAFGGGWREDGYSVRGDGAGNGQKLGPKGAPGSVCVDPLLNCANGTNWYAGSFHNANGYFGVREGFLEIAVPLIDTPAWGKADLSLAGRHAKYTTAGSANTWKVGLTWDTPVDGVRIRALQSRDFRAPNLSELFAAPVTANGSNTDPWRGGQIQVIQGTLGNPLLKAEKSINTQLGVVLTPSWFPGFNTSLDYYRIAIGGQVQSVPQQTSVNNCFAGLTQFCAAIQVAGGASPAVSAQWIQVNSQSFNTATTVTDGFNWEMTYTFDIADWNSFMAIPGNFTFRGLATYVSKFRTDQGLPGTFVINTAGANSGNIPHLKGFFTQQYEEDNWEIHMSENWVSEGKFNNNWVTCVPGTCPVSTLQNPTVNDQHIPGIFYINAGGSVTLNDHWKIYAQVDNVLDKDPPQIWSTAFNQANNGTNPTLYDTVGRMYHIGVRIDN